MSYLGRVSARASANSSLHAAAGAYTRAVPAMRIHSPVVEADQRLGLPQFASLTSIESAPPEPGSFARAVDDRAEAPAFEAESPMSGFPTPTLGAVPRVFGNSERERDASATPLSDASTATPSWEGQTLGSAVASEPRVQRTAPDRALVRAVSPFADARESRTELKPVPLSPAARVDTTNTSTSTSSSRRSESVESHPRAPSATAGLLVAMSELNSWLNSKAVPASGDQDRGSVSAAASRASDAHSQATATPLRATDHAHDSRPRFTEPALLSALPSQPLPSAPPRAPRAAPPVIHIGRIEVEVVPAPSTTPLRAAPVAPVRAARAPRTSFDVPRRPFGWRQR